MALSAGRSGAISFSFPGLPQIKCVFTTRETGNVSLLDRNGEDREKALLARERLFASLKVDSWSELKQVHGDMLVCNSGPTEVDAAGETEADGHATDAKNHALMVKTADCQPILLAHPDGYVGAVHAGWRGNVLEFPRTAVELFCKRYGLNPADVRAVRGPSLGYAEFVNFSREWPSSFTPWFDSSTNCVDLWSLTRQQLRDAGLKNGNIYGVDFCTYSQNESFFSHRRGDTGRQVGIIWRT